MDKAIDFFEDQLRNIRIGRITTGLLDTIRVECYEQKLPLEQIAWTEPSGRRILITPYDVQALGAIDKSLRKEGFNSYIFSKTQVVVNLPPASGEDREKVKSQVKKIAEEAKISIRNIRKKYRQSLNKDDLERKDSRIQKFTDQKIELIEKAIIEKMNKIG